MDNEQAFAILVPRVGHQVDITFDTHKRKSIVGRLEKVEYGTTKEMTTARVRRGDGYTCSIELHTIVTVLSSNETFQQVYP